MESVYLNLLSFFKTIFLQSAEAVSFLTNSIPGINISPLALLTINGLVIYIGIAVGKWLIS